MAKNTGTDRNTRAPFTAREDALILEQKDPDAKLSKRIGRSVCAIQMRRSRLTHPDRLTR